MGEIAMVALTTPIYKSGPVEVCDKLADLARHFDIKIVSPRTVGNKKLNHVSFRWQLAKN